MTARLARTALVLAALAAGPAPAALAQEAADPGRPTVGLVLSGGGARGLAHVGVLEALEELRIPVDLVAGTSMGAIVGGLYASGLSPAEIRALMSGTDWDEILADTPRRSALDFARRAEQHRYAVELEIGLTERGLSLPPGLIAGQELGLLLRRATLPVAAVEDFTRLPTPYLAVGTDLETGERVVLDEGDLVQAMRASMAIPAVFTPVEIDDRLLVDGGLVDQLPVGLARDRGAGAVIAVDVTPRLLAREELQSLLGVSQQSVILASRLDVAASLAAADVAMDLEQALEDVSVFDFRDAEAIMAIGREVTRSHAAALSRWSVSPEAYAAHRAERARRRPPEPATIAGVRTEAPEWLDPRHVDARVPELAGSELDPARLEAAARSLYALGEFERVGYDLSGPLVILEAREKPHGPRAFRVDVDLVVDSGGESPPRLAFETTVGYQRRRIGDRQATWTADLRLGTRTGVETSLRQPLDFAGRWFVEPFLVALETSQPVYPQADRLLEYEVRQLEAGLAAGRVLGASTEIRVGLAWGRATAELDRPEPTLAERFPDAAEDVAELRSRIVIDRLDAVNLPRRGFYLHAEIRDSREGLGADRAWTRLALDGRGYWSRGPHTLFAAIGGGTSNPDLALPPRERFRLGGFGSLSGFEEGELRGDRLAFARAGWLWRITEVAPALRAILAGGWIEAGDAWLPPDEEFDPRPAATLSLGAETILGPLFLAYARAEGGRGRLYLALGRAP